MNVCLRCPCPKLLGLLITRVNDIDHLRRGNGVARPTLPRQAEADREDEELDALQESIDVERLALLSAQPLPATRGAITRLVKTGMPVPGRSAAEETKQPIVDNLHEPRTPVDNPPRKRKCRGTKWGTPSEKPLKNSRKCVISRAYKAAVREARKSGANGEAAARAGRTAFAVAGAAYEEAMACAV